MSNSNGTKGTLGRGDLVAMAIGNIIGGGIMSLLGIAIGLTGRSIVIAIVICSIMIFLSSIPQIFASSTIKMNGGFYTQASLFGGKWFGGVYSVIFISYFFSASLYALSFAHYVLALVPGVNIQFVAMLILTVLVIVNLIGIQVAAKAQYIMVILLTIALLAFAGFGLVHVKPGFTQAPDFLLNGFSGIMSAAALMSFALVGSTFIVNFSGQCKNPTKDIPFAIIVSTIVVTLLYVLVAIVAAGVLPLSEIKGKSLAITAYEVLPYPIYLFFIICGAMIALVTSLNALLGWITPPIVQACNDGWFPKFLGERNKRFGTPHWILLIIYVLASMIILLGWDIGSVANVGNFLSNAVMTVVVIALTRMPKVIPDIWAKSKFRINDRLYVGFSISGALMTAIFCYYLAIELTRGEIIGTVIYLAVAFLYPLTKMVKRDAIKIETSYESI
ncbi:APC family permease [Bacillus sp. FJAT-27245]|uniref:APC family permease n=1 Tax=Bacillus sp. FJAT-27245 TaxID=1684144 RepID=UPI0006A7C3B7|nr:APC family permease [Bacillus sp. FJAT-27245]